MGMEQLSGQNIDGRYLVLYLLVGTLVWRYLSLIFYWITDVIGMERWEGTIEYTLMAPVHRVTHMAGQTFFALIYSLIFTSLILAVTVVLFDIDLSHANMFGGTVYYPIRVLPEFEQKLAVRSPATYVLDGSRLALLEGTPTSELWPFIWPTLIMGLLAIPIGLWVFGMAERYAKRTGKLHRNG